MSIFENRFEHILYFRDTCDISCVEFMLYASVHSRFTAIWHYLASVIGQRVEGEYTVGKLARAKKNIFKTFPDKYHTACSVHQHSGYIHNCFHFLLEYSNKLTYRCIRSNEHWYRLRIFISIWLASMFPQFFRMYYVSPLIGWRKQLF